LDLAGHSLTESSPPFFCPYISVDTTYLLRVKRTPPFFWLRNGFFFSFAGKEMSFLRRSSPPRSRRAVAWSRPRFLYTLYLLLVSFPSLPAGRDVASSSMVVSHPLPPGLSLPLLAISFEWFLLLPASDGRAEVILWICLMLYTGP